MTLSRLEHAREELPAAAAAVTQVLVDNPAQFVLIGAATLVATRALANLVKPRTPVQALAVFIVMQVGSQALIKKAISEGWLKFRIRDEEGHLVPLEVPDPKMLYFYPDHGAGCRGHLAAEIMRGEAASGCPVVPGA